MTMNFSLPISSSSLRPIVLAALMVACAELVRSGFYMGYLARVATQQGLVLTLVGAAWSTHLVADTLMRGLAGWALQRWGAKWVALVGASLCVAAFSLLLLGHSLPLIMVVAALHGAGFAALWPVLMNVTADLAPEGYQARLLSMVSTVIQPVAGAGLFLYGALAKSWDWSQTVFLSLGLLGMAAILSLSLPATRIIKQDEMYSKKAVARALIPLLPAALMQTLTQSMVGAWMLVASPQLGLTDFSLGGLLVLGGAVAFGLMPWTGKKIDRNTGLAHWSVAAGYGLVGLGFLGFMWHPSVWVLGVAFVVAGLGYAWLTPAWAALVTSRLPESQRPAAWGVIMTVESAGFAVGPVLGGMAMTQHGASGLFLWAASLAFTTAIGYILARQYFI